MKLRRWAAAAALALVVPLNGTAAQFPEKVVRIVMPFSLGGGTDTTGRIFVPHLSERWKQQVLLEPRPGASTILGTEHVAKSAADGYTLLFTSTQYVYAPSTFAKLPYDPLKDLVPVTLVSVSPQMIVAHPSLPVRNPKELLAFGRSHPGQLNLGNAGSMLPTLYFIAASKLKMEAVPYKGAGPMMIDLMGGHVPLAMAATSSVQGAVRAGKARIIGVCSLTPSVTFPEAPVIANDIPGFEAVAWFGIFAPRGTPPALVRQIRDDIAATLQIPDVRKRMLGIGAEPSGIDPEAYATKVRAEIDKWNKVARDAGIKPVF